MAPATATKKRAGSGNTLATAAYGSESQSRRQMFDLVIRLNGTEPGPADAKKLRGLMAETSTTSRDIDRWIAAIARRAELQSKAGAVGDAVTRRTSGRSTLKEARAKLEAMRETVAELERGMSKLGAGVRECVEAEALLGVLEYEHADLFGVVRPDDPDQYTLTTGVEVVCASDPNAPEQYVPTEVLQEHTVRRSSIMRAAHREAQAANNEAFAAWQAQGYQDANGRWQPPQGIPSPKKIEPTWASIATLTRAERDRLAAAGARA